MKCIGHNMNAGSSNYNYTSKGSKVSFDGFINENYFEILTPETNLVQNLEISHAFTTNPITYIKDVFICFLLKSKYDGIGIRKPIELSIALDISGSMSSIDGNDGKSRIKLAKESLTKLVSILDEQDKMSLITFNQETKNIFGPSNKHEIQSKYLEDLQNIKANGGTALTKALIAATNNLSTKNSDSIEQRIVLITDVEYNDSNNNLLNLCKKCVEEKGVPITIIAISSGSNLNLADKVCQFKGCNYFPISKSSELEDYLAKNFNYIFFPLVYYTKIKVKSNNSEIIKCIGGDNELIDEFKNKIENIKENDDNVAPNPSNEVVFDIGTAFASELLKINEKTYVKGGIVLLKINPTSLEKNKKINFDFTLEYTTFDGQKCSQNYTYEISNQNNEDEYFYNNNIQKALSIYYFSTILNYIVETYNKMDNFNEENKYAIELLETKQVVIDYLKKHFIIFPNDSDTRKHLDNYLKLIETKYSSYRSYNKPNNNRSYNKPKYSKWKI